MAANFLSCGILIGQRPDTSPGFMAGSTSPLCKKTNLSRDNIFIPREFQKTTRFRKMSIARLRVPLQKELGQLISTLQPPKKTKTCALIMGVEYRGLTWVVWRFHRPCRCLHKVSTGAAPTHHENLSEKFLVRDNPYIWVIVGPLLLLLTETTDEIEQWNIGNPPRNWYLV